MDPETFATDYAREVAELCSALARGLREHPALAHLLKQRHDALTAAITCGQISVAARIRASDQLLLANAAELRSATGIDVAQQLGPGGTVTFN